MWRASLKPALLQMQMFVAANTGSSFVAAKLISLCRNCLPFLQLQTFVATNTAGDFVATQLISLRRDCFPFVQPRKLEWSSQSARLQHLTQICDCIRSLCSDKYLQLQLSTVLATSDDRIPPVEVFSL